MARREIKPIAFRDAERAGNLNGGAIAGFQLMRSSSMSLLAIASMFILSGGSDARATLLGYQYTATYNLPDLGTPYDPAMTTSNPFTAGVGIDAQIDVEGVLNIDVDVQESQIVLAYSVIKDYSNNGWNFQDEGFSGVVIQLLGGLTFVDLGFAGASFSSIDFYDNESFNPSNTPGTGTTAQVISTVVQNVVTFNWNGLDYDQNNATASASFLVPEPGGLSLLGLGLAWLLASCRRQLFGNAMSA